MAHILPGGKFAQQSGKQPAAKKSPAGVGHTPAEKQAAASNMIAPGAAPGSGTGPLGEHFLPGFESGGGPTQIYEDLLKNYSGKWEWLQHLQEAGGPFIAASLGKMPSAEFQMDFMNMENPMQAFGQGAGMIGTGAAQGLQAGQNQMARAGLGRSASMSGMAQRATQGAANQQAGLFTNLYQATQQRQSQNARNAFDLQRQIAQMALGGAARIQVR